MVKTSVRYAIRVAEAVGIGLLLLAAFLAWQVSRGPVALDFLAPYANDMLNAPDRPLAVHVGGVEVAWAGWAEPLDVRATDVNISGPGDRFMALAPRADFILSADALWSGRPGVRAVTLRQPEVVVYRDTEGRFPVLFKAPDGPAESGGGRAARLRRAATRLLADGRGTGPGRYLERVRIVDGAFTVHDQRHETTWALPAITLTLERGADGLHLKSDLRADLRDTQAHLRTDLTYAPEAGTLAGTIGVDGLDPLPLADLLPQMVPAAARVVPVLRRVQAPVSGKLEGTLTLRGGVGVRQGRFDLTLGSGALELPAPVDRRYTITEARVTGRYVPDGQTLKLERIALDPAGTEARITGRATVRKADGAHAVDAETTVEGLPVERVSALWPKGVAGNARAWIDANMAGGTLPATRFEVKARLGPDGVTLTHFRGEGRVENTRVTYLDPMPPVQGASGDLTLLRDKVHIDVDGGHVHDLDVAKGRVDLTKVHSEKPMGDINLTVTGPLGDALRLIDAPPLGYAGDLGLSPDAVAGTAETRLSLRLPLLDDLALEDVAVEAEADLTDVRLPDAVMGRPLENGDLALDVNRERLDVSGRAEVAGVPLDLTWERDFAAQGMGHYTLKATLDDAEREALGLGGVPFRPPLVTGPVKARLEVDRGPDKSVMDARLDLTGAQLTLPRFGWRKRPDEPGEARIELHLVDGTPRKIPEFTVNANDLVLEGGAAFEKDGSPDRVDFQRFAFGRTDLTAMFLFNDDGSIDVDVEGRSFDATNLLDPAFTATEAEDAAADTEDDADPAPPITLSVNVDRVWVSENGAIGNVAGAVTRRGGRWRRVQAQAVLPGGASLDAGLEPDGAKRRFRLDAGDAGQALRVLDLYDNMAGGDLSITGTIHDDAPNRPLEGRIRVRDFHVTDAPLLARLLSVASLTGILDILEGEGLAFKALEIPFRREHTVFHIEDGRAWGASLGITGSGRVNLNSGAVNLDGTIVPAYTLNSLLGRVPLVGHLFSGAKGGGVFAATYHIEGTPEEATIDVNPLAALAPGVLRNLFGGPPEELDESLLEEGMEAMTPKE